MLVASNLLWLIATVSISRVLLVASVLLWTFCVGTGTKSLLLVNKTLLQFLDFTKDATLGAQGGLLPLVVSIAIPGLVQVKGSMVQCYPCWLELMARRPHIWEVT